MNIKEARKILGINGAITRETINKTRKDLLKKYHPDAGGSNEQSQLINEAYSLLKKCLDDNIGLELEINEYKEKILNKIRTINIDDTSYIPRKYYKKSCTYYSDLTDKLCERYINLVQDAKSNIDLVNYEKRLDLMLKENKKKFIASLINKYPNKINDDFNDLFDEVINNSYYSIGQVYNSFMEIVKDYETKNNIEEKDDVIATITSNSFEIKDEKLFIKSEALSALKKYPNIDSNKFIEELYALYDKDVESNNKYYMTDGEIKTTVDKLIDELIKKYNIDITKVIKENRQNKYNSVMNRFIESRSNDINIGIKQTDLLQYTLNTLNNLEDLNKFRLIDRINFNDISYSTNLLDFMNEKVYMVSEAKLIPFNRDYVIKMYSIIKPVIIINNSYKGSNSLELQISLKTKD